MAGRQGGNKETVMQLTSLHDRLTDAELRRRHERIARRRQVLVPRENVSPSPRLRFVDRIKAFGRAVVFGERRAHREKAAALALQVEQNKHALRLRSASTGRCTYRRQYVENGQPVVGDPCGGKLRAHRRLRVGEPKELQCDACGRVYQGADAEAGQ